jgi:2-dehydropantoate 2-reductase
MKIAVLGAGSLGCAMGGVLTESGHEVWLINRHADRVEHLRRHGLVMRVDGVDRRVAVRAALRAEEVGPVDLVIVLVKSFHTDQAMAGALALMGPQTDVLSLQNGLGHEDILARHVGRERVLVGRTYVGGSPLGPGHVIAGYHGKDTHLGELDGAMSERAQRIAQVFNAAGLHTLVSQNILGTVWDKLLINVATGAITAITGLSYGQLYAQPQLQTLGVAAVEEAMAVARARGIALSITDPLFAWNKAGAGLGADFKTSMLQSLEKASVTEIDYVNGAVVALGERLGVATPVNRTLLALVKGLESRLPRQG